jgi:hypothetical protein
MRSLLAAVAVPVSLMEGSAFAAAASVSPQLLLAGAPWGCPGGSSCYYEHPNGQGRVWVAPSCGFYDLGQPGVAEPVFNDQISSIDNAGNGEVKLFNWGDDGWHYLSTIPQGVAVNQLPAGVDDAVDAVDIQC